MAKKRVIISSTLEDFLSTVGENIKLARLRRKITATVVRSWPNMAKRLNIPSRELSVMKSAFRVADEST